MSVIHCQSPNNEKFAAGTGPSSKTVDAILQLTVNTDSVEIHIHRAILVVASSFFYIIYVVLFTYASNNILHSQCTISISGAKSSVSKRSVANRSDSGRSGS